MISIMQASGAIIFLYPAGILDGLAQIFPPLPASGMGIFQYWVKHLS